MKSTVVDESLSSFKPMYCSREYQASTRDLNLLGLKVLKVGFLTIEEPSLVLDKKHQTKLLGIIGWNLIWLTYMVFTEKYWEEKFNSFQCPAGGNPLLFSQLCLYYYADVSRRIIMECNLSNIRQIKMICSPENGLNWLKKVQPSFIRKDGLIGQVMIGYNNSLFASLGILP